MTPELYVLGRLVWAVHKAEGHIATFWLTHDHASITCTAEPCRSYRKAVA